MVTTTALLWFFLFQSPGDVSWAKAGMFESQSVCAVWRINFLASHPNMQAQPCQREQKE